MNDNEEHIFFCIKNIWKRQDLNINNDIKRQSFHFIHDDFPFSYKLFIFYFSFTFSTLVCIWPAWDHVFSGILFYLCLRSKQHGEINVYCSGGQKALYQPSVWAEKSRSNFWTYFLCINYNLFISIKSGNNFSTTLSVQYYYCNKYNLIEKD